MMQRIFSNQFQSITGAALVLGAASFLSRIVGLVRERMLAHTFGAGMELDMYTAAFRVPDFLYNILIVGALSAGFIPIFLELYTHDKKKAWEFTSNVLNITFIAMGMVSLILFFTLPWFFHFFVPGFSPEAITQTIALTRIMLLSAIFLGLSAVVSNVLQSLRSFLVYSFAPIFYNFGIIIGALFLVPSFGIHGLAYGVVLGAMLHLLVQLPLFFQYGFRFSKTYSFKEKNVLKLIQLMLPRTLTLATVQINSIFITFFASTLTAGSIALFSFATNIASFPIGIIGISFAIAAFPMLAEMVAKKDTTNFETYVLNATRQILFFKLPITVLFLLLRAQIIRVLLGTGAFDWKDTIETAQTLGMLALSFFAQCLNPLFIRAFYALKNTRTPLFITILSLIITLVFAFILKNTFGVPGLALAISLGQILQLAFLWFSLQKYFPSFHPKSFLYGIFKMTFAVLCMGFVIQMLKYPISLIVDMEKFWGIFLQAVLSGSAGILVYVGISYFLRLPEMLLTIQSLEKRFLKFKQIPNEIEEIK